MTTSIETLRIADDDARSEVWLAPTRGGMATRWRVRGRDVFYLDEATLTDATKNVRGGCPVLFPSPGALSQGRFARDGKSGAMKQHGFARDRPWSVGEQSASSATLTLEADAETLAQFPWPFRLTYRYTISGARLSIHQRIECTGLEPVPFGAGFHPYFFVRDADKARATIPTTATRGWDNVRKRVLDAVPPIDLTAPEVDLHLDHGASRAELDLGDGARIVVEGSDAFRCWVVWTVAGKDYVCLEPWTSGANALNDGTWLLTAAPGEPVELETTITLVEG